MFQRKFPKTSIFFSTHIVDHVHFFSAAHNFTYNFDFLRKFSKILFIIFKSLLYAYFPILFYWFFHQNFCQTSNRFTAIVFRKKYRNHQKFPYFSQQKNAKFPKIFAKNTYLLNKNPNKASDRFTARKIRSFSTTQRLFHSCWVSPRKNQSKKISIVQLRQFTVIVMTENAVTYKNNIISFPWKCKLNLHLHVNKTIMLRVSRPV